jgi:hypothetical protein
MTSQPKAALTSAYPAAEVKASTFDAFFAVANQPQIKAQLPLVTGEIEDAWIYGVPSDPLKNAQLREASRQRLVRRSSFPFVSCMCLGVCCPFPTI